MASGNTLCVFEAGSNRPPASAFALIDSRNSHLVLAFDDSTAWSAIFEGVLPRNYAGGGITATIAWLAASATSGNVVWAGSFERHQSLTTDLTTDNFAAEQSATAAAPGTTGQLRYTTIAFTDGAQINSLAAGESFRFKLRRDAANGADTMTGNAQVLKVELRET